MQIRQTPEPVLSCGKPWTVRSLFAFSIDGILQLSGQLCHIQFSDRQFYTWHMKQKAIRQVDYGSGSIFKAVMLAAGPMVFAQILSLLYNIVDRMYIGRIPGEGASALAGIGLCFPVMSLITAFANLYGSGGAPLAAMEYGRGNDKEAGLYLNASFLLTVTTGLVLTAVCELFAAPVLTLFGARGNSLQAGLAYLRPVLLGTVFSMTALTMNPYINAQGFPAAGMMTVLIGAVLNICLDPVFIFLLGWKIRGAAAATVLSQVVSALFVLRFLTGSSAAQKLSPDLMKTGLDRQRVVRITSLGLATFIMQVTNSLVQAAASSTLAIYGGDLYISVMTIVASVRQIVETPLSGVGDGAGPVMSFNYGAANFSRLKKAIAIMTGLSLGYAALIWGLILLFPAFFTGLFSSDKTLCQTAVTGLHVYFFAFVFQALQFSGQTVFKSLGKRSQAIFFSLFRKVILVVPLTLWLPRQFGVLGVFAAEPVSNVLGGLVCYSVMYWTVLRKIPSSRYKQADMRTE